MGNFKVKVNNEAESKEIQNILESIGFRKWDAWSELGSIGGFIWTDSDMTYCDNRIEHFDESPREEITLLELRAMVNPMKEYLEKQPDGTYSLVLRGDLCKGDDIEVPDGMNYAYGAGSFIQFTKQEIGYRDSVLVWQRSPSLNDQYAEIEQVRQAIKVQDGNDSDHALDAISYGFMGIKQDNVNNPQHYNKGGVECIDAIEASMTPEAFKGYLKGNVQKYMWRYEQKGGVESLRKAQWYLERLVASMGS